MKILARFQPNFDFELKGKRSRAKLKILQLELWLKPARLRLITIMYPSMHATKLPILVSKCGIMDKKGNWGYWVCLSASEIWGFKKENRQRNRQARFLLLRAPLELKSYRCYGYITLRSVQIFTEKFIGTFYG